MVLCLPPYIFIQLSNLKKALYASLRHDCFTLAHVAVLPDHCTSSFWPLYLETHSHKLTPCY